MKTRVLCVEDDAAMLQLLDSGLTSRGFDVLRASSGPAALKQLESDEVDVLVTDLNMRGMTGLDLCERSAGVRPDVPVIVITAFGSLDTAIAALRAGAYDFIPKPFEIDALRLTIERAVRHRALQEALKRLRLEVRASQPFDDLVGKSAAMEQVSELVRRVAAVDSSVLITGESGTGKELVARALHRRSRRGAGPFVAVNCAALPEQLLESELFGHAKGAFTDARANRAGLFVQANGGTIFLDEIGELPLSLQAKLLRALQERTIRPVGSDAELSFDARIVAATNEDLETAVEEKRFREDLYYRINVIRIELPPLRSRGTDVLLLAHRFLDQFAAARGEPIVGFSPEAAEKLLAYPWPGNVRELQNCVERAVALTRFSRITAADLPERVRSFRRSDVLVAADDPSELLPMVEVEKRYIRRVMEAAAGNKSLAAQILGFDRTTLYRKLEKYGIPG